MKAAGLLKRVKKFDFVVSQTNAWLLYRRDCDLLGVPKRSRMTYINFIIEIADALISANKVH